MDIDKDLVYQIALTQIKLVGHKTAKALFAYFGSAEAVFKATKRDLLQVTHVGEETAATILSKKNLDKAAQELLFIEKQQIQAIPYTSKEYPTRLKNQEDSPLLLFYKGTASLNNTKIIAIVGTRKPTEQGRAHCERLVMELKEYNPLVVSGLAYGIDVTAHHKCVQMGVPTVGIVAHGLDRIYPSTHQKVANEMMQCGGILTEFLSGTEPLREHFPMRNRLIAGIADAVIVVETARTGGSMITADLANEYQKDVFAIPGRVEDEFAQGCNLLIKTHRASLLESVDDIAYILRWDKPNQKIAQPQLFVELSPEEKNITNLLLGQDSVHLDVLIKTSGISTSKLSAILLELEFRGIVKVLAGKHFRLM